MKNLLTFIFLTLLLVTASRAQTSPEQIVSSFNAPSDWISKLMADSSFLPLFERKQIAHWTFRNKPDSTIEVTFYLFNYAPNDFTFFDEKEQIYIQLSSCFVTRSDKPNENFISFHKDKYFFLLKRCPCNTRDNGQCKQLAKQLFEWMKGR